MAKRGNKLTHRQKRMLDYYYGVSNFEKTDAIRRAGYVHANNQVWRLFNTPAVVAEMERREAAFRAKYEVTYERVRDEVAKIAFFNPLCVLAVGADGLVTVDVTKAQASEMAAISEIRVIERTDPQTGERTTSVKLKPWNKLGALEALMRHAGISREKVPTVQVDLVERIRAARERAEPLERRPDDDG